MKARASRLALFSTSNVTVMHRRKCLLCTSGACVVGLVAMFSSSMSRA
jgi:hypothetical protein